MALDKGANRFCDFRDDWPLLGTWSLGVWIYDSWGPLAALSYAALAVAYYVYLIRKWRGRKNRASSTDHANP